MFSVLDPTKTYTLPRTQIANGIDQAIARTRAFFESVGIATRLSDYGLGQEAVDAVLAQLTAHRMVALGEHRSITPDVSRAILQAAL